jgi:hypothetical protein
MASTPPCAPTPGLRARQAQILYGELLLRRCVLNCRAGDGRPAARGISLRGVGLRGVGLRALG